MKAIYILVLSTFLYSCSDNYEQDYNDFTEFNQADWSLQSWFPNLISTDCFNLKEIHNLKTNSSFGRSSYKSNNRINSLLPDVKLYKKATFDSLNKFFRRNLQTKETKLVYR